MRLFNRGTLVSFGKKHAGSEYAFRELIKTMERADWCSIKDVKEAYPASRSIKGDRVIFNVMGNKYRVVAALDYQYKAVFIKFVGTHSEYDKIDAKTVNDH